jgi:putative ATP-dependent endonuclease of OLD family
MILKEVTIQNYRKFIDVSLSLTDDITLLAGANNSGKTSLIDLLESILGSRKASFSVSDIPVIKSKEWVDHAYPIFSECFNANLDKDQTIKAIVNKLFSLEPSIPESNILIPPTVVKFKIDYALNDDIRHFADYIMDLDLNEHSFYFVYSFDTTALSLGQALENDYDKLKGRYEKIEDYDSETTRIELLKEKLLCTYASSIIEKCYYTDSKFENRNEMNPSDFRKLFNFRNIHAGRPLDDQNSGKTRNLSKNMIDLACNDTDWKSLLGELPDKILRPIEDAGIIKVVREASINGLSEAIHTIAKANGGNTGSMVLDIDISEDAISSLINQIMNAKYQLEGYFLSEASQGLGYSNMIYILLQLETYKRNIDPLLVNIFIIEEPESHMHPQMQNVFGKYLRTYYQQKRIQGFISTHSSEMVRVTDMKHLRVARPFDSFDSKILDFSSFKQEISKDPILDNFYDWFYEIGFSDVVFADRVILYEGDTERMLIRKLSSLNDFQALNQQYIAFVQVGGAYAYNYRSLIEFLKIKTLILTDLDYDKGANTEPLIKESVTTNATINNFYKITMSNTTPTISDLYQWKADKGNILFNGCAYLNYQGVSDNFARTLEEAMLAKHYKIKAFEKKKRDTWLQLRSQDKLKYTIPQKSGNYSLRDIVSHTSNGKTDFMYSVILNNLTEEMLPEYIKEGLTWLMQ